MRRSVLFLSLATLVLASACAGGSSGSRDSSGSNEPPGPAPSEYNEAAFAYTDPHPPEFHPLARKTSTVTRLDEGFALFANLNPTSGLRRPVGPVQFRDDIDHASAQVPVPSPAWTLGDFEPHDSCSGDLDGDGRLEPVYVGLALAEGSHTAIRMSNRDLPGGPLGPENVETEAASWSQWSTGVSGVHCAAGDLDGDGTDELVLCESLGSKMHLRILSRTTNGVVPVFVDDHAMTFGGWFGRAVTAQLDGDDAAELVVAHGTPAQPFQRGSIVIEAFDDLGTGLASLGTIRVLSDFEVCVELVSGEFDGDATEEIALGIQDWVSRLTIPGSFSTYEHYRTRTASYDWVDGKAVALKETTHESIRPADWAWDARGGRSRERFVAADYPGDGLQRVVWLQTERSGWTTTFNGNALPDWSVSLRTWDAASGATDEQGLRDLPALHGFSGLLPGYRGGDLAVVDDDGSGDDNLLVTLGVRDSEIKAGAWQVLVFHPGKLFVVGDLADPGPDCVPFSAGGDYDGEGLRLEYTGVKYTKLPDPIPMVVMAAPPTKEGADQNVSITGSTYSVSNSTTEAYTVTNSLSLTYSRGVEWEDLIGNFSVAAKHTVSVHASRSLGTATTLTTSRIFNGSYDADSIVFQGTLYQLYEYRVVAAQDPAAVGTLVALDVPVATKIYKWTTDYYDANVDPEDRLPADLFTHTVGDPTSYPSQSELTALLDTNGGPWEGWEGTSVTVGQGQASNGISLAMEEVTTNGTSYGVGGSVEAEWKIAGPTYGLSVAVDHDMLYEVSVSKETTFGGTIGDIDTEDWPKWYYDVGMVVYTRHDPDEQPYQVLQYWTEPLGSSYP